MRLERSRVQLPAILLSGNNLRQVVHTHVPVTKQYNLVPVAGQRCPATGKVTIGLASHWPCIRLQWFIHLWAQGLSKGDEHPTNTPHGVWYSLPLFCSCLVGFSHVLGPFFFAVASWFVNTRAVDCLARLIPHMTCYVMQDICFCTLSMRVKKNQ